MNTFNFEKLLLPEHKELTEERKRDLSWFLGFAEGAGSWQVDRSRRRMYFMINQKDAKLLYKIRQILGFGKISSYPNFYRYSISNQAGAARLISICNGNLLLNQTQEPFQKYLELYNENLDQTTKEMGRVTYLPSLCFKKLPLSLENAWLAGFLDAEGCFNAHFSKEKLLPRLRFTVIQREEEMELMSALQKVFGGTISKDSKKNLLCYACGSKEGHAMLLNYLKRYPLYSRKSVSIKRFEKIFIRKYDGLERNSLRARQRLERLCVSINRENTFLWKEAFGDEYASENYDT